MSRRSRQRHVAQQLKRGDTYSRDDGIDWSAIARAIEQTQRLEHHQDRARDARGQTPKEVQA